MEKKNEDKEEVKNEDKQAKTRGDPICILEEN